MDRRRTHSQCSRGSDDVRKIRDIVDPPSSRQMRAAGKHRLGSINPCRLGKCWTTKMLIISAIGMHELQDIVFFRLYFLVATYTKRTRNHGAPQVRRSSVIYSSFVRGCAEIPGFVCLSVLFCPSRLIFLNFPTRFV